MQGIKNALRLRIFPLTNVFKKVLSLVTFLHLIQIAYQPQIIPPAEKGVKPRREIPSQQVSIPGEKGSIQQSKISIQDEERGILSGGIEIDSQPPPGIGSMEDQSIAGVTLPAEEGAGEHTEFREILTDRPEYLRPGDKGDSMKEIAPRSKSGIPPGEESEIAPSGRREEISAEKNDLKMYHISRFSSGLRTIPAPILMLDLIEASTLKPFLSVPSSHETGGKETPVPQTVEERQSFSKNNIPPDESETRSFMQADSENIDESGSASPSEEIHTDQIKSGGPGVDSPELRRRFVHLYLPVIAARASIPIRMEGVYPVREKMPELGGDAPATGFAREIRLEPHSTSGVKVSMDAKEKPILSPIQKEGYIESRGTRIDLDESKILKREDIGMEDQTRIRGTEIEVDKKEETGISISPEESRPEGLRPHTEEGIPIIFGIAPILISGVKQGLKTRLEYPIYPAIERIKKQAYPIDLNDMKEKRVYRVSLEDKPYEEVSPMKMEEKQVWMYALPSGVLGSAIKYTLPPWVNHAIRSPGPLQITPAGSLPPQKGFIPKKDYLKYKVSEDMADGIRPVFREGGISEPGKKPVLKKSDVQKSINEREVIKIVKQWMEEEAKRKGFL